MKSIFKYILFLIVFIQTATAQVRFENDRNIPDKPNPPVLVNDFASLFASNERLSLENKLVAYNDSTSTQITVVTVNSLNGYAEDDYALRLGRKWGIGQKDKNNGILILISKEDRAVNIELGYGIEQYISDADAKRLIENVIIPYFRNGNFYQGVNSATDDMIAMLNGTYNNTTSYNTSTTYSSEGMWVIVVLAIIFLAIIIIASNTKGGGGSGGSYTGGRGGWTSGPMYGGGGSSWSGGSSSGGFGGFGGGSFGGGGASGRW